MPSLRVRRLPALLAQSQIQLLFGHINSAIDNFFFHVTRLLLVNSSWSCSGGGAQVTFSVGKKTAAAGQNKPPSGSKISTPCGWEHLAARFFTPMTVTPKEQGRLCHAA